MPELIKEKGLSILILEDTFSRESALEYLNSLSEKPDVVVIGKDNLPDHEQLVKMLNPEPFPIKPYALPMVEPYLDETKINSNPHRNPKSGNCKIVRK